jgi:hypothetical protein
MKRVFIGIALLALSVRVAADKSPVAGRFDLVEATIPSIQTAIKDNIITAQQLVELYLARIAAYDETATATHLNSFIHVNEDAVHDAREADQGRANGYQKRPLSASPSFSLDNIDTKKMPTTVVWWPSTVGPAVRTRSSRRSSSTPAPSFSARPR